jgi:hypothetical protein
MVESGSKGRSKAMPKDGTDFVVKRRTHLSVVLGITFCVIGGAVAASSCILDWALPGSDSVSMWELFERGGVYLLAPLVPVAGALAAIFSSLDILAEKGRKRFKSIASLGALAASLLLVISLVIVAFQIESDYVAGGEASFGPALFMSVFGGVLALSGGMILTIDYLEARRRRGRFVASGGSAQLKSVLRPPSGTKKAKAKTADKRLDEGAPLTKEERELELNRPVTSGLECPTCYSPVQPNWQICPICGQELL